MLLLVGCTMSCYLYHLVYLLKLWAIPFYFYFTPSSSLTHQTLLAPSKCSLSLSFFWGMEFNKFRIRSYEGQSDRAQVEDLERRCEVGPSESVFLFTDTMGDPICRIRNSPMYMMLVSDTHTQQLLCHYKSLTSWFFSLLIMYMQDFKYRLWTNSVNAVSIVITHN